MVAQAILLIAVLLAKPTTQPEEYDLDRIRQAQQAMEQRRAERAAATRAEIERAAELQRRQVAATQPVGPPPVVYVLDYSGSMLPHFDDVTKVLKSSISTLRPDQTFNLVAVGEARRLKVLSTDRPLFATEEIRTKAFDLIDELAPGGSGYLEDAIGPALRFSPSVLWLYTDGDISDDEGMFDRITIRNKERVPIHTFSKWAQTQDALKTVQRLADLNQGECYDADGRPTKPPAPAKQL